MTDDQFKTLVSLLKDIKSELESISSNTSAIGWVEDHVRESSEYLKKISESN